MQDLIMSPVALWKDYDPDALPIEIDSLSTVTRGDTVLFRMYFTAHTTGQGKVRAYAELSYNTHCYEAANSYLPAVLVAGDLNDADVCVMSTYLRDNGYAVIACELFSDLSRDRATLYPDDLAYCRYENAAHCLYDVEGSPRETPWYMWTVICRRAITVLRQTEFVHSGMIGVIGCRRGAPIATSIAAMDDRVRAVCIAENTGWPGYSFVYGKKEGEQVGFFAESQAKYSYALSVESNVQFVRKPMLMVFASNNVRNDFDRAFDTYTRLPDQLSAAMHVTPRADGTLCRTQAYNMLQWMEAHVRSERTFAETPELVVRESEGKIYARVTTVSDRDIEAVEIFYAYDEPNYGLRNWFPASVMQTAHNKWLAELEPGASYLFCFATVTYRDGISVSSGQTVLKTQDVLSKPAPIVPRRLIYDATMGTDCFTCVDAVEFTGGTVSMGKGPMGVSGVMANGGDLATYKIADPRYAGFDGDMLNLTCYCAVDQELTFVLGALKGTEWHDYECVRTCRGGEVWQKLTLALKDFHGADGRSPEDWQQVHRLTVRKGTEGTLLIGTILWT